MTGTPSLTPAAALDALRSAGGPRSVASLASILRLPQWTVAHALADLVRGGQAHETRDSGALEYVAGRPRARNRDYPATRPAANETPIPGGSPTGGRHFRLST